MEKNFIQLFANSFRENWDLPALTDYGKDITLNYSDVAKQVAELHVLFELYGIQKGDKIALLGRNSSNWVLLYTATVTYGAVIVPILHEFNPSDINHIIGHSESKMIFVDEYLQVKLNVENTNIIAIFSLKDFSSVFQGTLKPSADDIKKAFVEKYPAPFSKENIKYAQKENEELASINYTSGTTGFSKGVMCSGRALAGNVTFGITTKLLSAGNKTVSFLPFAHAYGCAFDFLTAICTGSHMNIIVSSPTPALLLEAFAAVRPNVIFSVPMIIDKIYQKQLAPTLANPIVSTLLKVPLISNIIRYVICKKLKNVFGGNFFQIVIGGAAMNPEAEAFFKKIHFPFTIGYGMTECAPLISYTPYNKFVPTSCGKLLPAMELKIVNANPESGIGEVYVRGENLMDGYYKNPEATEAAIDKDGWFNTGDLGYIDKNNTIFLRGRSKTMILGTSGQNIYPEEIESKLSFMPYVAECLIVESKRRLVALVYPDKSLMEANNISEEALIQLMEINKNELNKQVASYERVSEIHIMQKEFQKTPKKSIKRFLYQQ